jgi:hypothetical protein
MKLRTTYLIAGFAAIYLIVTAGACAFILFQLSNAGSRLEERIGVIAQQHAAFQTYNELTRLAEETKEDRAELQTYLLSREETSAFLTSVEGAGSGLGVEVNTNSLKEADNALLVQFRLSGSEEGVNAMLRTFEALPYRSSLASLAYNRSEGSRVEATVDIKVSLTQS